MSRCSTAHQKQHGFTLVEMLIIAPIALLVITGFVVVMVTMVGDAIVSRNQNVMTYDIQSALNTIERDVQLSTEFLTTSGTMPSPQGKNGNTLEFTSTSGDIVLGAIATDKNPIDPTRGFVYYDTPFGCSDPSLMYKNRIFFMTVMYTVRNGSLWRRTYVPAPTGTRCQSPWQVNTCAPGYSSGAAACQANDSEILKNVKTFTVSYYGNPEDTIALAPASANEAKSIRVFLEAEQTAAGRTFNASSSGQSTKLNEQQVTLAPPDAPTVTASYSGTEALFSWPTVPTASSYIVEYNITGNGTNTGWVTASENTPNTLFSVPANYGDTISVRVRARNTTGASSESTTSITIPIWTSCDLQNGWVNFGSTYESCAFTITKAGVVIFKGYIKDGSTAANTNLFQLPENMRPSNTLMYQTVISPSSSARIDVRGDGWVRLGGLPAGTSSAYLGLDGIYFIPEDSLYNWSSLTLMNGWTNFGGGFPPLQYTQDTSGRVHIRGLAQQGTFTAGTHIAELPSSLSPQGYYYLPARSGTSTYNVMGIDNNGAIEARGTSSTYVSHQAMYYPSTHSSWTDFSGAVSGTPGEGQLGNNWVAYGAGFPIPAYTKSSDGIVTIKGLVKNGSTSANVSIGRLPAGYRPNLDLSFSVVTNGGAGHVDVDRNGYIKFRGGTNTWLSLNNISFIAEK